MKFYSRTPRNVMTSLILITRGRRRVCAHTCFSCITIHFICARRLSNLAWPGHVTMHTYINEQANMYA